MSIEINKHLFASYCGLVASGYSLTNQNDLEIQRFYNKVKATHFPQRIIEYFASAKTNQIKVNPYYPRGSDISAACFFFDKPLPEFLYFLKTCGSSECNEEIFISWISKLQSIAKGIEELTDFDFLYNEYVSIVEKKCFMIAQQIKSTQETLRKYGYANDIEIIFAPNLLQSQYLTDFAFVNSKLYIIATEFSEAAVLHEYFHIYFAEKDDLFKNIINEYGVEKFIDTSKIIKIGYMMDCSMESQCHALKDCIIRGIVGAISTSISKSDYCKTNADMGFVFVPDVLNYARVCLPFQNNIEKFIDGAIRFAKSE